MGLGTFIYKLFHLTLKAGFIALMWACVHAIHKGFIPLLGEHAHNLKLLGFFAIITVAMTSQSFCLVTVKLKMKSAK